MASCLHFQNFGNIFTSTHRSSESCSNQKHVAKPHTLTTTLKKNSLREFFNHISVARKPIFVVPGFIYPLSASKITYQSFVVFHNRLVSSKYHIRKSLNWLNCIHFNI